MRLTALLLIALLPAVAAAQDSVTVAVPEDRNCSDFVSQQDAQGWYDAVALITGQPDAHGLDSDGDGQPCEGLEWGKVETLGNGYAIRYDLVPAEYECETVQEPFSIDALRDQAALAATDSIPYRGAEGVWPRWECVHTISVLVTQ
jgi:opacity protein-like surface antigen